MLWQVVFVAQLPLQSYEVDVGGDDVPQSASHAGERYGNSGAARLVIVSRGGNVDQLWRQLRLLRETGATSHL